MPRASGLIVGREQVQQLGLLLQIRLINSNRERYRSNAKQNIIRNYHDLGGVCRRSGADAGQSEARPVF